MHLKQSPIFPQKITPNLTKFLGIILLSSNKTVFLKAEYPTSLFDLVTLTFGRDMVYSTLILLDHTCNVYIKMYLTFDIIILFHDLVD